MNGYQVIAAVAERSDGIWRPGPGSVYPALGLLQDEGLIAPDESDASRRKVYALTDEGRTHVSDHGDELAAVWDQATRPHRDYRDMRLEFGQLGAAIQQVLATGDERQFAAAQKVLAEARRAIYRILAADEPASE
jgi:DNA-binding PadR family transcriptional regulator